MGALLLNPRIVKGVILANTGRGWSLGLTFGPGGLCQALGARGSISSQGRDEFTALVMRGLS